MSALVAIAVTVLAGAAPAPAMQSTCPPSGARFQRNNIDSTFVVVSEGGAMDDTLGCRWRREDTGARIWLTMELMRPLGPAGGASTGRPATPTASGSASLGPIAMGVYECDSPAAVGGSIMGRPVTGFFFGVTAPGAYRDFDGGRGAFSLNGDVLTMTSGPLRGIRYRRQAAGLFRPLDAQGQIGPIRCVLNRAKALTGRW